MLRASTRTAAAGGLLVEGRGRRTQHAIGAQRPTTRPDMGGAYYMARAHPIGTFAHSTDTAPVLLSLTPCTSRTLEQHAARGAAVRQRLRHQSHFATRSQYPAPRQ